MSTSLSHHLSNGLPSSPLPQAPRVTLVMLDHRDCRDFLEHLVSTARLVGEERPELEDGRESQGPRDLGYVRCCSMHAYMCRLCLAVASSTSPSPHMQGLPGQRGFNGINGLRGSSGDQGAPGQAGIRGPQGTRVGTCEKQLAQPVRLCVASHYSNFPRPPPPSRGLLDLLAAKVLLGSVALPVSMVCLEWPVQMGVMVILAGTACRALLDCLYVCCLCWVDPLSTVLRWCPQGDRGALGLPGPPGQQGGQGTEGPAGSRGERGPLGPQAS